MLSQEQSRGLVDFETRMLGVDDRVPSDDESGGTLVLFQGTFMPGKETEEESASSGNDRSAINDTLSDIEGECAEEDYGLPNDKEKVDRGAEALMSAFEPFARKCRPPVRGLVLIMMPENHIRKHLFFDKKQWFDMAGYA
ncbi:hypothetical protein F4810DRAFT_675877 [Camillea tinctor]|nr:hypothetical protein F4810DRAFT_675877 [Camillea tinctor]